jgi:DNA replication and repair protein RecF
VIRTVGVAEPVLLLDDVFSELDPNRAAALLEALPGGQRILTTAAGLPSAARPDHVIRVHDSTLTLEAP